LAKPVGATTPVEHRSVGRRPTLEIPSLDDALESLPLGLGNDVDHLDFLEMVDGENASTLKFVIIRKANLLSHLLGFNACLGGMPLGAFVGLVGRLSLRVEPYLDCRIAILVGCLYLQDGAGARLDYGNGDKVVVAIVHLGHPKLLSY